MSSHRVLNNLDCVQNVATFAFHSYACTSQFESIYCVLALFRCRAMHRAMHVPSIRVRSKRNASSMLAMCIVYVCVCVALSCRLYLASHRGVYCCVQYRHRTHYVLYFYTRMFFFSFIFCCCSWRQLTGHDGVHRVCSVLCVCVCGVKIAGTTRDTTRQQHDVAAIKTQRTGYVKIKPFHANQSTKLVG